MEYEHFSVWNDYFGDSFSGYRVVEGTAYIAYSKDCNTALAIAEVPEGDTFHEGVGEDVKGIFESYQEASEFIQNTFFGRS